MERKDTIGFRVRTLSVAIKRAVDASKAQSGVECTGTHGWVIGYLYENRSRDVYQRDIEKQFSVRRPTMTAILQLMEKNGLIVRERCDADARLKKIRLTDAALQIHESHERLIEAFENALREGITDDEIKAFFAVADKISANVDSLERRYCCDSKEEKNA